MSRRFFFYGTLVAGSANPVARAVHARLRALGPVTVAGRIFAIDGGSGWYPALVEGKGVVHGALYEALPEFGAADLAALDAYEGAEYARVALAVSVGGEADVAEGYRWVGALPAGAVAIAGGDFGGWLAAEGRMAWGG